MPAGLSNHGRDDSAVAQTDATKRRAVRLYDLQMLDTASGYDLTMRAERIRSRKDLEKFFFRLIRALKPDVFIEAGAKNPVSSRRARRYHPGTRPVAFEANPYTYERFRERNAAADSPVEYLNLALSDEPGPVRFHVRKRSDGGAKADGQGSLLKRRGYAFGHEIVTVDATTIDLFFEEYEYETCVMWIDVEGASGQVLQGAHEVLQKTSMLFIEVEERRFWRNQWIGSEVAAHLYDYGLISLARDYQGRHQYNVVYVREDLLDHPRVRSELVRLRWLRPGTTEPPARAPEEPASRSSQSLATLFDVGKGWARTLWRRTRTMTRR